MGKKKPSEDPAAPPATLAAGEAPAENAPPPRQSPTSEAIRVIQAVCGVGCVQAKRYLQRLKAEQQAAIVARFAQPDAHDEIRRLVLDAQQPQKAPADEPSGDANDA